MIIILTWGRSCSLKMSCANFSLLPNSSKPSSINNTSSAEADFCRTSSIFPRLSCSVGALKDHCPLWHGCIRSVSGTLYAAAQVSFSAHAVSYYLLWSLCLECAPATKETGFYQRHCCPLSVIPNALLLHCLRHRSAGRIQPFYPLGRIGCCTCMIWSPAEGCSCVCQTASLAH